MDSSDSAMTFDNDGVCDHCLTLHAKIKPNWHMDERGRAEFDKLVAKIKKTGEGKKIDCIIGVSGGIDSSYLAWLASKRWLRPIIYHDDAGWGSQGAVNKIQKLIEHLDLDIVGECSAFNPSCLGCHYLH
jgi:hypothetical protein